MRGCFSLNLNLSLRLCLSLSLSLRLSLALALALPHDEVCRVLLGRQDEEPNPHVLGGTLVDRFQFALRPILPCTRHSGAMGSGARCPTRKAFLPLARARNCCWPSTAWGTQCIVRPLCESAPPDDSATVPP